VRGALRLVTAASSEAAGGGEGALAKARRVMWAQMSPRARLSWLWPAPRSPRPDGASDADYEPEMPACPQPPPPPPPREPSARLDGQDRPAAVLFAWWLPAPCSPPSVATGG
jgi:hypothetical protein